MFEGCRGLEKDRLDGGEGNEAGLKEAAGIGFAPSRFPCVVLIGEEGNVGCGAGAAGEFRAGLCAPDAFEKLKQEREEREPGNAYFLIENTAPHIIVPRTIAPFLCVCTCVSGSSCACSSSN